MRTLLLCLAALCLLSPPVYSGGQAPPGTSSRFFFDVPPAGNCPGSSWPVPPPPCNCSLDLSNPAVLGTVAAGPPRLARVQTVPSGAPTLAGAQMIPSGPQVLRVPVLMVIYTNTAGGTIGATEIKNLRSEIDQWQLFCWRNSHMKLFIDITYLTITDYKPITDFWEVSTNNYWMGSGPVATDLAARGIPDQYACVVSWYAWVNGAPYYAAFGAAMMGIYSIGHAAYIGIPLCWNPKDNDWLILHEFNHAIDSFFEDGSEFPEFCSADSGCSTGIYGTGYDFNNYLLRMWPPGNWLAMSQPWGFPMSIVDADGDGFPDSGATLPLTEATFGSDPTKKDTDGDGLSDLDEAMAGIWKGSQPRNADTDGDGIPDGLDAYPLYAVDEYTPKRTATLDGTIEAGWHFFGSPISDSTQPITASIYTNWDPDYLYLAFTTSIYTKLWLQIDANHDGWGHGRDQYSFLIDPDATNKVVWVRILDCTPGVNMWDTDPRHPGGRMVVESDIHCSANKSGNTRWTEIAVPRNTLTGLVPGHGKKMDLEVVYGDDWNPIAHAFEYGNRQVTLTLVDAPALYREATTSAAKARPDGQWIDLIGKTVSALFAGSFYIQDEDRSSGIKVLATATSLQVGDKVRVVGELATVDGERVLRNAVVDRLTAMSPH